jgi:hypothetical protein
MNIQITKTSGQLGVMESQESRFSKVLIPTICSIALVSLVNIPKTSGLESINRALMVASVYCAASSVKALVQPVSSIRETITTVFQNSVGHIKANRYLYPINFKKREAESP